MFLNDSIVFQPCEDPTKKEITEMTFAEFLFKELKFGGISPTKEAKPDFSPRVTTSKPDDSGADSGADPIAIKCAENILGDS